jgi:hypothetical protein
MCFGAYLEPSLDGRFQDFSFAGRKFACGFVKERSLSDRQLFLQVAYLSFLGWLERLRAAAPVCWRRF